MRKMIKLQFRDSFKLIRIFVAFRTTLTYPLKQPTARYNKKIESGGGVRITDQLVVFAGDFMAL